MVCCICLGPIKKKPFFCKSRDPKACKSLIGCRKCCVKWALRPDSNNSCPLCRSKLILPRKYRPRRPHLSVLPLTFQPVSFPRLRVVRVVVSYRMTYIGCHVDGGSSRTLHFFVGSDHVMRLPPVQVDSVTILI